jgi:regulator of protease activity HflC (stomatin/prohibitin superfamily)
VTRFCFKHFRKERPDVVLSIEKQVRAEKEKKAEPRRAKQQRQQIDPPDKEHSKASPL